MTEKLKLADKSPVAPEKETLLARLEAMPLSRSFRIAIVALGVFCGAAVAVAEDKPQRKDGIEQLDLSGLTENDLINGLGKILGSNTVYYILHPVPVALEYSRSVGSWSDDKSILTDYELDEVSPAQKLANAQKVRDEKIALGNRLKPYLDEAKKRNLRWANRFDNYLEIPEEPRVNFAEGKFATFSNAAMLDGVKGLIGERAVSRRLDMRRYPITFDPSGRREVEGFPKSILGRYELDEVSPAQKLANAQKIRSDAIDLANKLRPLTDEAKTRQLSWAKMFNDYLQTPEEPKVNFAEGKFAEYSNAAMLDGVKKILGEKTVSDIFKEWTAEHSRALRGSVDAYSLVGSGRYRAEGGLNRNDNDDESPAQKLAKKQKEIADATTLANKLKPFIDEARIRDLSWANMFNDRLMIPDAPKIDFADGSFKDKSNKALFDSLGKTLGASRVALMISSNFGFDRDSISITKGEEVRIAPLMDEARKRGLSWTDSIEGFYRRDAMRENDQKLLQEQDSEFAEQVKALELKLKTKYGINIHYGNSPYTPDNIADAPTCQKLIKIELNNMLMLLNKYPENVRSLFRNTEVYIVIDLRKEGKGSGGIGGSVVGKTKVKYAIIDSSGGGMWWALDHELFHTQDSFDESENSIWAGLNPNGMKDYVFKNGEEAIMAGEDKDDSVPPQGFARKYGKTGGPNEDKATIAQNLLDAFRAGTMYKRAKTDTVLRNKMEAMTGCLFDPEKGEFVRQLTLNEYKTRFGFSEFKFFAKWSRTKKGILTMDPAYWNLLATGNMNDFELLKQAPKSSSEK
ncbi:MAG: hypothetical protein UT33_C0015G0011 [Candidatus Peregrinibacteria bacterium GW2011_GWC2_39_14]|nr:MAG: hypothetical protein US92_C0007G0011 [Candidatus Peregrinibacteria bacterium GW2011_GWA2_38_36]KKR04954.1 MAG: hypothetical protein UT33_C0015G0011 [Candidatus Peregrinibacteria bacterium GW2011_GWC2_39_14]